mgnify:FL=1
MTGEIKKILEISSLGEAIRVANHSELKLIISVIPKPPKRKHIDFKIIHPESFLIFDHRNFHFDLTLVSFRFEK